MFCITLNVAPFTSCRPNYLPLSYEYVHVLFCLHPSSYRAPGVHVCVFSGWARTPSDPRGDWPCSWGNKSVMDPRCVVLDCRSCTAPICTNCPLHIHLTPATCSVHIANTWCPAKWVNSGLSFDPSFARNIGQVKIPDFVERLGGRSQHVSTPTFHHTSFQSLC